MLVGERRARGTKGWATQREMAPSLSLARTPTRASHARARPPAPELGDAPARVTLLPARAAAVLAGRGGRLLLLLRAPSARARCWRSPSSGLLRLLRLLLGPPAGALAGLVLWWCVCRGCVLARAAGV